LTLSLVGGFLVIALAHRATIRAWAKARHVAPATAGLRAALGCVMGAGVGFVCVIPAHRGPLRWQRAPQRDGCGEDQGEAEVGGGVDHVCLQWRSAPDDWM
jgi:hypothetical protein